MGAVGDDGDADDEAAVDVVGVSMTRFAGVDALEERAVDASSLGLGEARPDQAECRDGELRLGDDLDAGDRSQRLDGERGEVELFVELFAEGLDAEKLEWAARPEGRGSRERARGRSRRSRPGRPLAACREGSRRARQCARRSASASRTRTAPVPNGRNSALCGSRISESASLDAAAARRGRAR